MNLLEKFLQSKQDHCIEKYCDDGEPCLECVQGDTVRQYKIHAVKEWLHMECEKGDDCACIKLEEIKKKEED